MCEFTKRCCEILTFVTRTVIKVKVHRTFSGAEFLGWWILLQQKIWKCICLSNIKERSCFLHCMRTWYQVEHFLKSYHCGLLFNYDYYCRIFLLMMCQGSGKIVFILSLVTYWVEMSGIARLSRWWGDFTLQGVEVLMLVAENLGACKHSGGWVEEGMDDC